MRPDPKPTKRLKRRPVRAGVDSVAAPPAAFRVGVYDRMSRHTGRVCCLMCGQPSGTPDREHGHFDAAHLIPAQRIREEARSAPALGDWVYRVELAVWLCRGCHHAHDNGHQPITRKHLQFNADRWGSRLWTTLLNAAIEMDKHVKRGDPFTAYLDRVFPL